MANIGLQRKRLSLRDRSRIFRLVTSITSLAKLRLEHLTGVL